MSAFNLVDSLATSFHSGAVVRPPPQSLPYDLTSAERIQDAVIERLGPIIGWKLGATIRAVRQTLGLPNAFFGALPVGRIVPSHAVLPAQLLRHFGVEPELTFRLGHDLPAGSAPNTDAVRAAVASVHASFEIPATRFEQLNHYGGFSLVADNGAAGWLVVGEGLEDWTSIELDNVGVSLCVGDSEVARGSPAIIDGGPFAALVDHVRRAHRRQYSLKAGDYIATGSCTGYVQVPPGKQAHAQFEKVGSVSMILE